MIDIESRCTFIGVFMATAHLIHGCIGAGKTTFARRLEKQLPAIRFTHDEWMARFFGTDPPADQFPIFYQRVSEQIEKVWTRCLELGNDVVLDLNFWPRRDRDYARASFLAVGGSTRLYRIACPEDEAWRRVETRNANLDGTSLLIVRHTFEMLKSRFEPLGEDEERIDLDWR